MPIMTADAKVTASYTQYFITIPCQNQLIQAISIWDLYTDSPQPEQYAILGIMVDGILPGNRACVLASGYFGNDTPLGWSGSLITDPSMHIFAELYAYTGYTYRLSALVLQPPVIISGGNNVTV